MRKILLATAALVVVGYGQAMAADVQVTATVTAACTVTDTDNVTFGTDPEPGETDTSDLSFSCNFAGGNDGEEQVPLTVTIASANGGLNNALDFDGLGPIDRSYTVSYEGGTPVPAASLPEDFDDSSSAPNTPNLRSFEVALVDELPVAGSYADTLTVTIVP